MESQRNENSFIPVDPFETSINFSIRNIWQGRHETANEEVNDIYLRPAAPSQSLAHPYLPGYGFTMPVSFQPQSIHQDVSPSRRSRSHSRSRSRSRSRSAIHRSSADYMPIERQPTVASMSSGSARSASHVNPPVVSPRYSPSTVPSLLASGRGVSDVNPPAVSPRYSPSQASIHESISAVPPLNIESYSTTTYILAFILDTIPRQIYLHLLLRLPHMYFSRVTRIFEEAEMSMPQIKQGILEMAMQTKEPLRQPWILERSTKNVPFKNLQNTWQTFIDSLLREWKTLNIISALLLSAILTILQIDNASKDPLTRYAALISMICALMSLLYGCVYIIRFGTMRKSYKAAEWANEAQRTRQSITWNIWVLLAMPATWLAWSIILFIVCILSFVWRTGTIEDDSEGPMTRDQVLVPRIIVTSVLSLGLIYLVLMITTLRRYGEMMDRAWHQRILGWVSDTAAENVPFVAEKVTIRSIPTASSPVAPHTDAPVGTRARPTIVVPTIIPYPIPAREPERNTMQIKIIPPMQSKTMVVDTTTAVSSGPLESSSLPQGEHSNQFFHSTEVEASENRPKSLQGIEMIELYSITSLPNKNIIKRENLLDPSNKVWANLSPDGWDVLEEDLLLTWDANAPEHILSTLDKFNQVSADTIAGQLALCQKNRSEESKYAVFFFSFTDPLPHEQSRYEAIPLDLDSLDIWLSPPNAHSSSLHPEMDTRVIKVSLPSKRSNNTQSVPIISPISQSGMALPSEEGGSR